MSCSDGKDIPFVTRPWEQDRIPLANVLAHLPPLKTLADVSKLTQDQVNIYRRGYGHHRTTRADPPIRDFLAERNALFIDIGCSIVKPFTPNSQVGPEA